MLCQRTHCTWSGAAAGLIAGLAIAPVTVARAADEAQLLLNTNATVAEAVATALPGTMRAGRVNTAALGARRIAVTLPDGRHAVAVREREVRHGPDSRTWVGRFDALPGSLMVLTSHRGAITGSLLYGSARYELQPQRGGGHVLFEVDESQHPRDVVRPAPDALTGAAPPALTEQALPATQPYAAGSGGYIHDLLVVYTPASRSRWGQATLESKIISAVELANQAYRNSRIDLLLHLAGMVEISYTETGDMGVALDRLQKTNDGYMDVVHQLRDQYGADLVTLIDEDTQVSGSNACGIAYIMVNESPSFASAAFSVVPSGCLNGGALAHEIGHNQGDAHDRSTAEANGEIGGAFPYSYGYRRCVSDGTGFRTIMAYPNGCTGGSFVAYFSSPDVLVNGYPAGIDYEADPQNSADNARSMSNTADTVAAFRTGAATDVPAAPSGLTATAIYSTQTQLGWTDNANDETGYRIERSVDGVNFIEIALRGANATGYSDTGLTPGTAYWYRIRAYNSQGNSDYSNVASTQTPLDDLPAAPTNLTAQALSASSIRLSWTDNSTNENGFRVQRWNGTGWTEIGEAGSNSTGYTDNGLSAGMLYQYRVYAYNNLTGNSAFSNTASATTLAPPATPGDTAATPLSSTAIRVTWTDNAANEDSYELQSSTDAGSSWTTISLPANTTDYEATGLVPATQYWFRVRAVNQIGASAFGTTVTASTLPPPLAAPADLVATAQSADAIRLTWVDTTAAESGFELQRKVSGGWQVIASLPADTTGYTDTALAARTTYSYRLRAQAGAEFSAYSSPASATTGSELRPLPARSERDLTTLDANGDGSGDIAALADDGINRVRLIDGVTGVEIRAINFLSSAWLPRAVAAVADTNGDAAAEDPSLALLAYNPVSGRHIVQTRRVADATLVRNIYFLGNSWQTLDVTGIDDGNGDGVANDPAIGVLAFQPSTGRTLVQRRALADGTLIANTDFLGRLWTPIALAELPRRASAPWLGVLAVKSGDAGEILVQSRRVSDGALVTNTTFFSGDWMAQDLAALADADGNLASDDPMYAVLGTDPATGLRQVQLRNALTGTFVTDMAVLSANWRVIAAAAVPDVDGNGRAQIGILAEHPATGAMMTRLRDPVSGAVVRDFSLAATAREQQWIVRLFNSDDTALLWLNGQLLGSCTGANNCNFNISAKLLSGANTVRIELQNAVADWAYGYRITRDGIVWAYGRCGTAATESCTGSAATGTVFAETLNAGF